jgi:hypothetical protein
MTRGGAGYTAEDPYRIYLSNNSPAWVYVIGSDLSNAVSKVFPHDERTSAALFYKNNDIALPDEEHLFELDNTTGTTYNLVLYSQKELDIDGLVEKLRAGGGDFAQKTRDAIGEDMVPFDEITLGRQNIKFSSKSEKPVVAIVVEIRHVGVR